MALSFAEPSRRFRRGTWRLGVGLSLAGRGAGDILVGATLLVWLSLRTLVAILLWLPVFCLRQILGILLLAWRKWIYPSLQEIGRLALIAIGWLAARFAEFSRVITAAWSWIARQKAARWAAHLLDALGVAALLTIVVGTVLLGMGIVLAALMATIWVSGSIVVRMSADMRLITLAVACILVLQIKDARDALSAETKVHWDRYKVAAKYWSDAGQRAVLQTTSWLQSVFTRGRRAVETFGGVTVPAIISRTQGSLVASRHSIPHEGIATKTVTLHRPANIALLPSPRASFSVFSPSANFSVLSASGTSNSWVSIGLVGLAFVAWSVISVSISSSAAPLGGMSVTILCELRLPLPPSICGVSPPLVSAELQPSPASVPSDSDVAAEGPVQDLEQPPYPLTGLLSERLTWRAGSPYVFDASGERVSDLNFLRREERRACEAGALLAVGLSSADGPSALNAELAYARAVSQARMLREITGTFCPERSIPIIALGYTARWQSDVRETSAARPLALYGVSGGSLVSNQGYRHRVIASALDADFGLFEAPGAAIAPDTECLFAGDEAASASLALKPCSLDATTYWLVAASKAATEL